MSDCKHSKAKKVGIKISKEATGIPSIWWCPVCGAISVVEGNDKSKPTSWLSPRSRGGSVDLDEETAKPANSNNGKNKFIALTSALTNRRIWFDKEKIVYLLETESTTDIATIESNEVCPVNEKIDEVLKLVEV